MNCLMCPPGRPRPQRHLMEPDPDFTLPVGFLWLLAAGLLVAVVILHGH